MSPHDLWQTALGELQLQMTRPTYNTWLRTTQALTIDGDTLVIAVPNPYAKDWLEKRLLSTIRRILEQVAGSPLECSFVVQQTAPQRIDGAPLFEQARLPGPERGNRRTGAPQLNPRYTFEQFVVGSGNRLAHAAAQAVAERATSQYNPLFIYGGVGLGKTHLLHAIGRGALARGAEIILISSEKFTNDLINAIRTNSNEEFRSIYRDTDMLLIDDIHFIAGKESTQEEFFHTFNTIHGSEGQIVLTSDRPPQAIATLEDRLQSRFQWGLQVDVAPPDLETRIAILRAKAERQGYAINNSVIELIAQAVQQNIRELEGALNRVIAHAQCNREPLTIETARRALADLIIRRDPPPLPKILQVVAEYYDLTKEDLVGRSRAARVAEPRQVAMHLMREETDSSYPAIGAAIGGRDHTTVLHGCEKIGRLLDQDPKLRRDTMQIRERLYVS